MSEMKLKLDAGQCRLLSDKLADTANYSLVGLALVELTNGIAHPVLLILGVFWYLWLLLLAVVLRREVKKQ